MSEHAKQTSATVAKIAAVIAALGLLMTTVGLLMSMGVNVAKVASDFGAVTQQVKGIGEKLDTHIRQTEDFRKNVEDRFRRIEGKVGIVMNLEAE